MDLKKVIIWRNPGSEEYNITPRWDLELVYIDGSHKRVLDVSEGEIDRVKEIVQNIVRVMED